MTVSLSSVRTRPAARSNRAGVGAYFATWKQRRELATLDQSRLTDLGISPAEAASEAARPFWDLP